MQPDGALDVVVGRALGTVLMTVRGPLRGSTAPGLDSTIGQALQEGPERLVLDLTGVTEIDDEGVAALRSARAEALDHQVQLVLTSKSPATQEALAAIEAAGDTTAV